MQKFLILPIFIILFLSSCATKTNDETKALEQLEQKKEFAKKQREERISFSQIKGFFEDDLDYALEVFKKDCQKSKRFEELKNVCQKAQNYTNGAMFFVSNFIPYQLHDSNSNDEGMITGYYEPLLKGSLTKTQKYRYPVYKVPKNLVVSSNANLKSYKSIGKIVGKKIVPYDTREEIERNPNNKNLEVIAYVDDKIDLFFLQVQGSGKIELNSGEIINIGYAGQNGHPYTSIGKYFIENEIISKDNMSMQEMKKYFLANPLEVDKILNLNKSYVFFQISNQGATGALNTVLTPKRNIAVDRSYIQLGMPVFLSTFDPLTKEPINQLMVAADVGGAIKGEIRADFFWGFGDEALKYAGIMKEKGKMYILKPKH